jgi:hypothetical protein
MTLLHTGKKKVKCTLVQALRLCTGRTAHTGRRGIALLFHDHCTKRWWGVSVTPRPLFTPLRKDPVTIAQDTGGPYGRSRQVWKISPPPGFDPRTVQPVASRYTALRYPAHLHTRNEQEFDICLRFTFMQNVTWIDTKIWKGFINWEFWCLHRKSVGCLAKILKKHTSFMFTIEVLRQETRWVAWC